MPKTSKEEVEFRDYNDDAWYNVRVTLTEVGCGGGGGAKLSVHYLLFPDHNVVLDADEFDSLEKLEDLKRRFRQPSVQLQDLKCRLVEEGTKVCASLEIGRQDVMFYDAIVEQV